MQPQIQSESFFHKDLEKIHHFFNSLKTKRGAIKPYGDKWKTLIPLFDQISAYNSVLILLYNPAEGRFVYAVDKRKIVGYDMSLFLAEDGMRFTHNNAHPAYIDAGLQMQQKGLEYVLKHKDVAEQNKLIMSFDYMYKKKDGSYTRLLQQSFVIAFDDKGHPLLFLNYVRDITYLKKDKTSNLVINTPDETKLWNYNFDRKMLEPFQPLSKQEKIVLDCLSMGKSSKEIAEALFISPHTVDTHRRNLLERTNCINTTGLVTYAKLVGLL